MARKSLTDRGVAALKPRAARYTLPDPELRGHYVRVTPKAAKSFVAVAVDPQSGKQIWSTVGSADAMSITEAREQARVIIRRVRAGLPPVEAKGETFGDVVGAWFRRYVEANGLRSRRKIELLLGKHVLPLWRHREFTSIRRSDVAGLLDRVEDGHGARQADAVLTIVRSVMFWFAARNDGYGVPIIKGMRRSNPGAQARARILDDDEIRTIWKAAEGSGTFGAVIRLCLLTAQRSRKVAAMAWSDFDDAAGAWTVPVGSREKGTGGTLVLPDPALAIVRAQPRLGDSAFVFAARGNSSLNGFSNHKKRFDIDVPDVPGWTLHDLRRSARSLMARAGVRPDIAERVMGHAIVGVEGVYDRHSYRDEKADALKRLAGLIDNIVNPTKGNVRPMRKAAR